ncbi:hypothetical protein DPMN_001874 [Dreissena polymorpha]|uniref:LRAT domain-containing protein n=1 Tax=Dreissena polymorpha TaxID=45954 RepID=A0A9D4RR83_DREPO|nr:hypothetical protein DPMN_001874 [Dreissena polymorpha]
MTAIDAIDEIEPGDAVVFKYWEKDHEGIVTSVTMDRNERKLGIVHIIHYAYDFPRTWKIIEETFCFNLTLQKICKKVYNGVDIIDSPTVVERAKARLGEDRNDRNYNTSRHLVEWAKVGHDSKMLVVDTYRHSTGCLFRIYNAYAWSDIETGCIIEFSYHGFKHQSVVKKINTGEDKITVIHYGFSHIFGTRTVMEENIKIDFKTEDIRIYRCDPAFNHNEQEDVVAKAEKRIGEQHWSIITNSCWAFCMQCLFH